MIRSLLLMPMIILLTGVQKSGKTTLTDLYSSSMQSIATVREVAREFVVKHNDIVSEPEFQDLLFKEQVKREIRVNEIIIISC